MDSDKVCPIDVDQVNKGDEITVVQLEGMLGIKRHVSSRRGKVEDASYQKALKDLQGQVKREMKRKGIGITVKIEDGRLLFMEDEAASPYNERLFRSGERRMKTALRQAQALDRGAMTKETRASHDRALTLMGAKVSGISHRVKVEFIPHQRKTPGLPVPV